MIYPSPVMTTPSDRLVVQLNGLRVFHHHRVERAETVERVLDDPVD